MNNYSQFKAHDFITDQAFINAFKLGPEEFAFYRDGILAKYPNLDGELGIATSIMGQLTTYDTELETISELEINAAIDERLRLDNLSEFANQVVSPVVPISSFWKSVYKYAVAACILVVFAIVLVYKTGIIGSNERIVSTTGFRKTLTLPDGSSVVLNTHSELKYFDNSDGDLREVWLKGEGFFTVSKIARGGNPVKFIVHTPNLDAEVKGTRFNVRVTTAVTEVMLEEGRVDVVPLNHPEQQTVLKPGYIATLKSGEGQPMVSAASVLVNTSWKSNRITFNNTSMQEVAGLFAHNFGKTLIFADTATALKHLGGTINSESLPVLLEAITKITDTRAIISGDSVILMQVERE